MAGRWKLAFIATAYPLYYASFSHTMCGDRQSCTQEILSVTDYSVECYSVLTSPLTSG